MAIPILAEYRRLVDRARELSSSEESIRRECGREQHRIQHEVYAPRIRALEDERDAEVYRVGQVAQERIEGIRRGLEAAQRYVRDTRYYFRLMQLMETSPVVRGVEAYHYDRSKVPVQRVDFDCVAELVSTEYLRVSLFLVSSSKPTNCYALILVGSSIFNVGDDLLVRPPRGGYLSGVQTTGGFMMVLREGPSKDKLLDWYRRHGLPQEYTDYLTRHAVVEADYVAARGLFNDREWLRAYLEYMRDYYIHGVTGGTQLPEYKKIMERLSALG